MNNLLLFLLKSTLILSLLYLVFRLLMRNETVFRTSRIVLLLIVFASVVIPCINLPRSYHPALSINLVPLFQRNIIEPVQINEPITAYPSVTDSDKKPDKNSTTRGLLFVYLSGVFISFFLFVSNVLSLLQLLKKARKTNLNGIRIMILDADITAFSLGRLIMISQHDYENNTDTILAHELSHIKQGHFYDLILIGLVKIIYWFNPLVYRMEHNLKDIHEYQADELTLNSGIDTTKYQLLLIQKCVGHQSFALANSFNNYQIKKRITMMNKSKTRTAWHWKVTVFLPVLTLLLMAFGKRDEIVTHNSSLPISAVAPSELVQKQYGQFKQKIEIKMDGNYIDNKLCSLQDIAKKGQEWYKGSNEWIFLLIDESIPLSRVDEVREALTHSYWIVQATAGSDDLVYFAGDVSFGAKFKQGTYEGWLESQFRNYPEIMSKEGKFTLSFSYIISKDGKVRDAHIIKGCDYPEINAVFEKILTQIPDWEPARRGSKNVSVYVSTY